MSCILWWHHAVYKFADRSGRNKKVSSEKLQFEQYAVKPFETGPELFI